jgi:glyoxylase-like metal-dependent hydrolase (beta-lactamase superfamily II)
VIIDRKGDVTEHLRVLGTPQVPCYMVDAPRPVLVDAGFTCLGPLYEADVREALGGREPAHLCLTHVHFDHCGAMAYLAKAFPAMQVCASPVSSEILSRRGAVERIAALNELARVHVEGMGVEGLSAEPFEALTPDRELGDGDELDLGGGLTLQVLAAPGHTRDFTSYYVPQSGILIAGEAVGCADVTGYIFTEFLVDYDQYVASLSRLASLPARVLCQGHHFVYTGDHVREYLERSLVSAREYREWVERLLNEEHGDVQRVVARVRAVEYDPKPAATRQPEAAYLMNLNARVSHLEDRRSGRV